MTEIHIQYQLFSDIFKNSRFWHQKFKLILYITKYFTDIRNKKKDGEESSR